MKSTLTSEAPPSTRRPAAPHVIAGDAAVEHMHVDGFRFDLASILSRDPVGHPMPHPPVLWDFESDPVLDGTKLIAEAWDAAGLYQLGTFIGDAWKEWNGRFRDDVRAFFRGEEDTVARLADRMVGSPEVYGHKQREAEAAVNFVTCHDGFSLNDLVSYNGKHNDANGEHNRDGADDNRSWNCGVEGPTDDSAIDWVPVEKYADVLRFVRLLAARRTLRDETRERQRVSLTDMLRQAKTAWHGVKLLRPDWGPQSHSLAFGAEMRREGLELHLITNAFWEGLDFELSDEPGRERWRRWIDTSLDSPDDIVPWEAATPVGDADAYCAGPRSVVVLWRPLGNGVDGG